MLKKNNIIIFLCLIVCNLNLYTMEDPENGKLVALLKAVEEDDPSQLEGDLQGISEVQVENRKKASLFLWAAKRGALKVGAFLLQNGTNRHATSQEGYGAMTVAAASNQVSFLDFLLQEGFNVDGAANDLRPLQLSVNLDAAEGVRFLLNNGATRGPFAIDNLPEKLPLLHFAALCGACRVVEMLVKEYGYAVNGKFRLQERLFTPNDFAVMRAQWKVAQILKEQGADATSHLNHMKVILEL